VESTGIDSSCKEVESSWHSIRNSIPLDSSGILVFSLPNLLKYSTGFYWILLESTGIQLELMGDIEDLAVSLKYLYSWSKKGPALPTTQSKPDILEAMCNTLSISIVITYQSFTL